MKLGCRSKDTPFPVRQTKQSREIRMGKDTLLPVISSAAAELLVLTMVFQAPSRGNSL